MTARLPPPVSWPVQPVGVGHPLLQTLCVAVASLWAAWAVAHAGTGMAWRDSAVRAVAWAGGLATFAVLLRGWRRMRRPPALRLCWDGASWQIRPVSSMAIPGATATPGASGADSAGPGALPVELGHSLRVALQSDGALLLWARAPAPAPAGAAPSAIHAALGPRHWFWARAADGSAQDWAGFRTVVHAVSRLPPPASPSGGRP